ncbi:MAG: ATP-dependent helicase HrpB, partial [Boseongicola sp.]
MVDRLPIDDILPDLVAALRDQRRAVVQAPPGAGKTTRVPLAMLEGGLTDDRIVLLEPRRLAARTAAARMAETLGENIGETVGYRIRGDTKISRATRIEVVTEGILTRMIQSDAALDGIGALIFDEFHERSLNADLGLALALDVRSSLRPDLVLVAMSATLDAAPVAALMQNAPVITSEGQTFPVDTQWLERPLSKNQTREVAMANLIVQAAASGEGGILAFLPGEREIRRVASELKGRIGGSEILPLYGALPFAQQRRAVSPLSKGRKIVLASAIAETSLTIPDIRIVVDGGQSRRARYNPGSGMSRLVTERVTRAEADQRRGRAGRVAKGQCFRLWSKGEEGALAPYPPAEIESADLASLALELADWGADTLNFLTPPPHSAMAEAQLLLESLGALDTNGRITEHGRRLVRMPLHPRLAHMLEVAGKDAAPLAALMADRDPMRGAGADLTKRLDALSSGQAGSIFDRIRLESRRLAKLASDGEQMDPAEQAALAYPDRIGLRGQGEEPR